MDRSQLVSAYNDIKRKLFDRAYSFLNDRQREAVYTTEGPLLVLAGAGSGKTTVLVRRIAFLIRYGNAYFSDAVPDHVDETVIADLQSALAMLTPEEIADGILPMFAVNPVPAWRVLAITFTNKAAKEMKDRLTKILFPDRDPNEKIGEDEVMAGTFHSVCLRLLRANVAYIGYSSNFTIYDADDTKNLISNILKEQRIDDKILDPKTCQTMISHAKDALQTPAMYLEDTHNERERDCAIVYAEYQKRLVASNAMDFDDIIMNTVRLLKDNPDVLEKYQRRFRYICVDEYQDTNVAQFQLCFLLSGGYRNLMVVGDDDQSIYAFRGATVENILSFDKSFPDCRIVKLEQNYRSTSRILTAANEVIAHNKARHSKKLWTDGDEGEKIRLVQLSDGNAEARYICDQIQQSVAAGKCKYSDNAILYRVNAQSTQIELALGKSAMPYRVLGGMRFFDRKEIRDIVAYLCLVNNPTDETRLLRIVNTPKRKISDAAIDAAKQVSVENGVSLFETMKRSDEYIYLANYRDRFQYFVRMIEEMADYGASHTVSELIEHVIINSGYKAMLVEDTKEPEKSKERLENLEELISTAVEYQKRTEKEDQSLGGYLEEVALVSDIDKYDETADAIVLMTIHSAKGLEFTNVYLPGMEEGLFPGMRVLEDPTQLDEERRLAYVAITRAKKNLTITHARERIIYGRTGHNPLSRFVGEIGEEGIEKIDSFVKPQTAYGAARPATSAGYGTGWRTISAPMARPAARSASPFSSASASKPDKLFAVGDRVVHLTFGAGVVTQVTPMGGDTLYDIDFDRGEHKRLMGSYAHLKAE